VRALEYRGKEAPACQSTASESGVASTARAAVEGECAKLAAADEFALVKKKCREARETGLDDALGHARGRAGERGRGPAGRVAHE
jgi:hypothetical protein